VYFVWQMRYESHDDASGRYQAVLG